VAAALVILAILYLRCGMGWGIGGGGDSGDGDDGDGRSPTPLAQKIPDAGVARCQLRIDSEGLKLAGKVTTQDQAIAACKDAGAADVEVTGKARTGTVNDLVEALDTAGVKAYVRQPGDRPRDGGL
jgi:hypothetical protein